MLSVVMCEDTTNESGYPGVSAVFESRRKADAYILKMNAEAATNATNRWYYMDTSFQNEFED